MPADQQILMLDNSDRIRQSHLKYMELVLVVIERKRRHF